MYEKKISKDFSCGMSITFEIIGGKWKPCIINAINKGIRRPTDIAKQHPLASKRVLSLQLSELERYDIIRKVTYPTLPPKVEYFLTQKGESLLPLVEMMEKWGNDFMDDFLTVQEQTQQKNMNTDAAV